MVLLPRFYLGLALAVVLALASPFYPRALDAALLLLGLIGAALVVELRLLPQEGLEAIRRAPPLVRQNESFTVELTLCNRGLHRAQFLVLDSPPPSFGDILEPWTLTLRPGQTARHTYRLRSYRRGDFAFGPLYYRVSGRLGLFQRQSRIALPQGVQVLPDLSGEGARDLQLARAGALQAGQRRSLAAGAGRDFESLREYQPDDDFRRIDWKASARRGRLTSRQYELPRDQRLLLVLDTGRLMSPRIGNLRKLDYAINAAIHLAQISRQKGDQIGYAMFNDELRAFSAPSKRADQLRQFVRDVTPLQATRYESDYALVFQHILRRCSRRTLIVCFTDLGDAHAAASLERALRPLVPRHLALIVTVSNSEIFALTRRLPETQFEVYRYLAATQWWHDYERTLRTFRARGMLTVSVPAEELSAAAINEVVRLKKSTRW